MKRCNMNPLLMTDVYKVGHEGFYPDDLNKISSYLTSRTDKRYPTITFVGLQAILKKTLMVKPTTEMVLEFIDYHTEILGSAPTQRMMERLHGLVTLGYWPLKVKAVKEGSVLPHKQCLMTVTNTHKDYAWLVGFFESMLLKVWNTCSVASNSMKYLTLVTEFADQTCDDRNHVPFAVHDFGYRGVSSEETAELAGIGHLTSFLGTDTIPAVWAANNYYGANDGTPTGLSVPATEHSTMSTNIMLVKAKLERGETVMGYDLNHLDFKQVFDSDVRLFAEALVWKEIVTIKRPTGIVSVVADTYDYFGVLTKVLPWLKADIEARVDVPITGSKVVVRPDSGSPKEIICGDILEETNSPSFKGSLELLAEVFGETENEKGYRVINPKIGLIYGDGMFFDRYRDILETMMNYDWATSNLVIGVGGLLLQQHSRDDLGFAVKATYAEVNGESIEVYKDPATDQGKKSHKGLMKLIKDEDNKFVTIDQQTVEDQEDCLLELVYIDGEMMREQSFSEIKESIASHVEETLVPVLTNLNTIDMTKQTITIGSSDNPAFSIMKGHVDAMTFSKGFREEGWNNDGEVLSDEDWKELAKDHENGREFSYAYISENGFTIKFDKERAQTNSFPITYITW